MTKTTASNKPIKSTNGAPVTLFNVSEKQTPFLSKNRPTSPHVARVCAGNTQTILFLHDASSSQKRDWARAHALWPLKVGELTWTSDHCHCRHHRCFPHTSSPCQTHILFQNEATYDTPHTRASPHRSTVACLSLWSNWKRQQPVDELNLRCIQELEEGLLVLELLDRRDLHNRRQVRLSPAQYLYTALGPSGRVHWASCVPDSHQ